MNTRVVVAGSGAICAAGKSPEAIWEAAWTGRSAIRPIQQWDASGWPTSLAGEIPGLDPRALVEDRKLHKLLQRSDVLGLYVAGRALDDAGFVAYRDSLTPADAAAVNDRTGVYVGLGGGGYQDEYEFFPLLTTANGDLGTFGRELAATVHPMWLLRSMPNNVLCHIGVRYGLKGPNTCVTNHSVSGSLAVAEAAAALRAGEADRALAVGQDAPIEPQMVLYYHQLGLLSADGLWPFDARRSGSLLGEGARRCSSRRMRPRLRAAPGCSASFSAAAAPARRKACSASVPMATGSRERSPWHSTTLGFARPRWG